MRPVSQTSAPFGSEILYLPNFIWLKLLVSESFQRSQIDGAVGVNCVQKNCIIAVVTDQAPYCGPGLLPVLYAVIYFIFLEMTVQISS